MPNIKLKISNPCCVDLQRMIEAENGKFCNACNTIVVDFTKMTTEEIQTYFLNRPEQKICGSFKPIQIATGSGKIQNALVFLYKTIEVGIKFKPIKVACQLLLVFLLTLMGCKGPVGTVITNDTSIVADDTLPVIKNKPDSSIGNGDTYLKEDTSDRKVNNK